MNKTIMFLGMLAVGFANAQEERVGINTESPSATLSVKTKTNWKTQKNLELEDQNGTKLVTVMNNGKVGVNIDNPEYILDLKAKDTSFGNNNIMLRSARGTSPSQRFSGLVFMKANGTTSEPKVLEKGDYLSGIYGYAYNGTAYKEAYFINGIVTGEKSGDKIPTSIVFGVEGGSGGRAIYGTKPNMIIHHTGNVGINFDHTTIPGKGVGEPKAPLEKLHIEGALKLTTAYETETIVDGAKAPVPNGGEGTIIHQNGHFFGWVSNELGWKQLDNANTTAPKINTGISGMPCNQDNRGKMNFDTIIKSDGTSFDVFGVCLKGSDDQYYWRYLYGSAGMNNFTGNFGENLD